MVIERALVSDAEKILLLQKLAFRSEAEFYADYSIEPLHQSLADLEEQFADHVVLKAVAGGRIIGSVRALVRGGTCIIGKLIVHPDWQNRGLGKRLMGEIEKYFATVRRFELCTGYKSTKNIRLYESLGFRSFKMKPVSENLSLVFMEKVVPKPALNK